MPDLIVAKQMLGFVTQAMKLKFFITRYKKQVIDQAEMPNQITKGLAAVKAHLVKLQIPDLKGKGFDEKKLEATLNVAIKRDKEFFIFVRGEIEEKIFDYVLPNDLKDRFSAFAKYSFFLLNGFTELAKRYYWSEKILSFVTRRKTALHYASIPGWPNLPYNELCAEVARIVKLSPRLYEKFLPAETELIDTNRPIMGEVIDKVLASGTISTETTLNLMTSEEILFVHKYAEDFDDIYKPQRDEQQRLTALIKSHKQKLKKKISKINRTRIEGELAAAESALETLHANWATVPIGTTLEKYGFERLFYNMDGVYGIPVSLLPPSARENLEKFFIHEIEGPARKYLKDLKRHNIYARNHKGDLKYIAIFHKVKVSQLSVFAKDRDIAVSPLLSKKLFRVYLSKQDNATASLYLHEMVRNVDVSFFLNEDNATDQFLKNNLPELRRILYERYQVNLAVPSSIVNLTKDQLMLVEQDLCKKKHKLKQVWRIRIKLMEIVEKYQRLEEEFRQLKRS